MTNRDEKWVQMGLGVGRDDIGTKDVEVHTPKSYLPCLHLSQACLHSASRETATQVLTYLDNKLRAAVLPPSHVVFL